MGRRTAGFGSQSGMFEASARRPTCRLHNLTSPCQQRCERLMPGGWGEVREVLRGVLRRPVVLDAT